MVCRWMLRVVVWACALCLAGGWVAACQKVELPSEEESTEQAPTDPEEDTPAEKMPDQIDEEVKEERQDELMELQQEIAFENAERMVGREVLVMIEGKVADENAYVGRTYRDAPNVDGLIFINTDEELLSGDFARVKVTGALDYDLIGELL